MKRQRKGIRSTEEKVIKELERIETARDMHPPKEKEALNQIFMTMGYVDQKSGTVYADLTGRFPITSTKGMTAMFIMYDWTSNNILITKSQNCRHRTYTNGYCRLH